MTTLCNRPPPHPCRDGTDGMYFSEISSYYCAWTMYERHFFLRTLLSLLCQWYPYPYPDYYLNPLNTTREEGKWQPTSMSDAIGEEGYDRLRPFSYPHTNVSAVCFSIINPVSLATVWAKWYKELLHHQPSAALV